MSLLKLTPEEFKVERFEKKTERIKNIRNKKKLFKSLRDCGKGCTIPNTMNLVPPRRVKPRCKGIFCSKVGMKCSEITDEERENKIIDYKGMGSLLRQREFIARHVETRETKQKTSKQGE